MGKELRLWDFSYPIFGQVLNGYLKLHLRKKYLMFWILEKKVMSNSLWLNGLYLARLLYPMEQEFLYGILLARMLEWIAIDSWVESKTQLSQDAYEPSGRMPVVQEFGGDIIDLKTCQFLGQREVQFSLVAQSCLTLCDAMGCSTSSLPVHHQLPEFTQTHVHWVSDAIQPSHPLLSPSPPAFNLSQHQGLFQWVRSSHQVAKVLHFQLQHQSFQWTFRTDFL